MSNLLEDYESYLTTEKKASANTVSSYLRDVHQFAQEMEERDVPLDEVLPRDVEDYIRGLTRRGKSAATVTRSVASIKSFYNCLLSRGLVESNPARNVTAAKVERKLPQILTSREVELFLEQPDCSDLKGYRDRAMLELLYATGIRVSELIELDVDDLNLYAGVLHCASKGKERVIPLYPAAIRALEEYLRNVRHQRAGRDGAVRQHERGPDEPPGLLETDQILPGEGRHPERHHAPHPAPLLRRPPAGERGGPALHPGDDGARGHLLHSDLLPDAEPQAEGRLSEGPPQSMSQAGCSSSWFLLDRAAPLCYTAWESRRNGGGKMHNAAC